MSLSTALLVLAVELVVVLALVLTTRNRSIRAKRLTYAFGAFTGLTAFWAFGLAGTDEALNQSSSGSTWIAIGLAVVNGIVFVTFDAALDRKKYGSNPA